jgi:hypothetical protein
VEDHTVVKYTTSLRPDTIRWLKMTAVEEDTRPARILERAVDEYRKRHRR